MGQLHLKGWSLRRLKAHWEICFLGQTLWTRITHSTSQCTTGMARCSEGVQRKMECVTCHRSFRLETYSDQMPQKWFYSIVILTLVDRAHKFIWVDVGTNGAISDAAIFNQSQLHDQIAGHPSVSTNHARRKPHS